MECPHCNSQLDVATYAWNNAHAYNNFVMAVTECCGHAVNIVPVCSFRVTAYEGTKTEDDWGKKIKPIRVTHD